MKAAKTIRSMQEKVIKAINAKVLDVISNRVEEVAVKYPHLHSETFGKFRFEDTGMGDIFPPEVTKKLCDLGYAVAIERNNNGDFALLTVRW